MRKPFPSALVVTLGAALGTAACGDCASSGETSNTIAHESPPETETETDTETPEEPPANPLSISLGDHDFASNPRLLARLRGSAHGYFRFINVPFSEQVCERFRDELSTLPPVNLHGDAHVEQYAVTTSGRGLTDYDDSSSGPGVLDLVRFGTSMRLACQQRGWTEHEQSIMDEFLRGYEAALENPDLEVDEPPFAARIREGFTRDRSEFLAWAESLMVDLEPDVRRRFDLAASEYVEAMLEQHPELPRSFWTMKRVGAHPLGIGSALDEKYLMRIEGRTSDPNDDVILEAKEVRDLSGISCIRGAETPNAFRVLVGQARIAYRPYPYLGYARFRNRVFWIHGWADNYHEMEVEELESPEQLKEIAYDVGVQLGRGHVNKIAAPLDAQLRRAQRTFLEEQRAALQESVIEMTRLSTDAWEKFAADTADVAPAD